ncbi:multidrug effflux MFS transporter [Paraburkholderia tropica]|uniref:multidrug effflux MFS transporter n=1 Tax=Paraburkholderia tropica TaxID=92647 RepID=UPI002AB04209|nr:multidrug effflux MFS transporter [Paraburkholderia tropica]
MQPRPPRLTAPILGILGALGPLSIDMYLPGLPNIARQLNVDAGAAQLSIMAFFAGLTIGQLFHGPLSDRVGRKAMIYVGLALYIAGSLGCAATTTAGQLDAWRFAQGLGGSIGMVIGFAVVRDLYTGRTAARLVGLMMIVQGVAPVIAPLLGTAVITVAPWPVIFIILALFGIVCILLVAFALPETRSRELRAASDPLDALQNYLRLVVSRDYMPYTVATALAQAGFFAYIAGSSFLFISVYGLSPAAYSSVFAVNALGLMGGTQAAPHLMGRFHPQAIIRASLVVYTLAAVLLVVLELTDQARLMPTAALLFVTIVAMAFSLPLGTVIALEPYGAISGTASALMGSLRFGAGTAASLVVGITADGTGLPMLSTIACCGLAACVLAFTAFPQLKSPKEKKTA